MRPRPASAVLKRSERLWFIVNPSGYLMPITCAINRTLCIRGWINMLGPRGDWSKLKRRGYHCARLLVTEEAR